MPNSTETELSCASVFGWPMAWGYLKRGYAVKRIGWLGYWELTDGNHLMMHYQDGDIMPVSGEDDMSTFENVAAYDWMVVDEGLRAALDSIHYLGVLKEPRK